MVHSYGTIKLFHHEIPQNNGKNVILLVIFCHQQASSNFEDEFEIHGAFFDRDGRLSAVPKSDEQWGQ